MSAGANARAPAQPGGVVDLSMHERLHSVLDEWVQWWRTYQARGEVLIVRYAADFIVGFQYEQ